MAVGALFAALILSALVAAQGNAPKSAPPDRKVLDAMVEFLRDPGRKELYDGFAAHIVKSEGTRDAAAMQRATLGSLHLFGEAAVPALIEFLCDPVVRYSQIAQDGLTRVGPPALPALRLLLAEGKAPFAARAVAVLAGMARTHWTPVLNLCRDDDPRVRAGMMGVLGAIASGWGKTLPEARKQEALDALLPGVDDADAAVRLEAVRAMRGFGPMCVGRAAQLASFLAQPDDALAWESAQTLGAMGGGAVPALLAVVKSDAASSRRYAAYALGRIGPDAAPATADLAARLRDPEILVRRNAADALGRLGDKAVLPALLALLADPAGAVQVEAADALKSLAPDDPAVLRAVEEWFARRQTLALKIERPIPAPKRGGLYPSQVPGYPGAEPGLFWEEGVNSRVGRPIFGHPEVLPYPGSVEHLRTDYIKYYPPGWHWDGASLVKLWQAPQLPGLGAAEDYAEPVCYSPMYGAAADTGATMPPVKVQRWRPGDAPLRLALGKLPNSYYVVRVVAAIHKDDELPIPKQMIMRFRVNDGLRGEVNTYTLRFRAVCQFYSVAEWFFRAWDDREFAAELSLLPETQVELLVHTIDVHDHLTFLARRAGKREPSLFPAAEPMDAARRLPSALLPPEEQEREDAAAWDLLPGMNAQYLRARNPMPPHDEQELKEMRAQGAEDPGWGLYLPRSQTYYAPQAAARSARLNDTLHLYFGVKAVDVDAYYQKRDRAAARRAALRLTRLAELQPTWMRQFLSDTVLDRKAGFGLGDELYCRKRTLNAASGWTLTGMAAYDKLYPFIAGNEELAQAVNRFLPDIRCSADLLRFLDTNLIQYPARLIDNYWIKSGHDMAATMLETVVIQQDVEITRPWMEYLFARTFEYPNPLSGMQDFLNAGTTRDGSTWIGSYFYTCGGARGYQVAPLIEKYLAMGGDRKYDITNVREFPKTVASCYFPLRSRVAGMYPLAIGDVGGPTIDYAHWFEAGREAMTKGWEWTRDPAFAFFLKHYWPPAGLSPEAAGEIARAAATLPRHPWFTQTSRVLSQWAGILESGEEHDDFRFRRAATVRVGLGAGHQHNDVLDLNLFAHGCVLAPDGGQRSSYGVPNCVLTNTHNLVEVNESEWYGHSWVRALADAGPAACLLAEAVPPANQPDVKLFRRHVALIDVDEGKPSATAITPAMQKAGARLPADVLTPHSYVFDVFRVSGGRVHTYCFHGGQNDELTHNVPNPRNVPMPQGADDPDPDRRYLRRYGRCNIAPERKWAGDAGAHVHAVWRLSREEKEFSLDGVEYAKVLGGYSGGKAFANTFRAHAAEKSNLGANYNPAAPREYTALHLLGQEGSRVLGAMWASPTSRHHFDQFFVQRRARGEQEQLESAFVALLDPYAGSPSIERCALLEVQDNETDARRAVAVEVVLAAGAEVHRPARTDVCFADGRPDRVRRVGDLHLSGHFALVSKDAAGLRCLMTVGGREARHPDGAIELSRTEYRVRILQADYLDRRLRLDGELPAALLDNSFGEIVNSDRATSVELGGVGGREAEFLKGVEILTTRIRSVDAKERVVTVGLGLPPAGVAIPGMSKRLTGSTEDRARVFSCDYLGGDPQRGYRFRVALEGDIEQLFPPDSALRVYEFGPGDELVVPCWAMLERAGGGQYLVKANSGCVVTLPGPGATAELSADGRTWRPAASAREGRSVKVRIETGDLGAAKGRLYLRALP